MHESLLGEGLLDEVFRLAKQKMINGTGFINGCQVGDFVSFHWDWACEVLARVNNRDGVVVQWKLCVPGAVA